MQVHSIMNRLKSYTFDNPMITIIHIIQVLQYIDNHDLICYLCLIEYALTSESSPHQVNVATRG